MKTITSQNLAGRRTALIVGHPGHELRVWGWMRAARPVVAVLTDGGGHRGQSRLHLSRELCEAAEAEIGPLFGIATDADVYRAILDQNFDFFLDMSDRLSRMMRTADIEVVVGDASEGYNPTHDLCRLVVDRAVRLSGTTHAIDNYAVGLVGSPVPDNPGADWLRLELNDDELARKIDAGRRYASAVGGMLQSEVGELLAKFGNAAFAHEYLQPVDAWCPTQLESAEKPFYETYGERQVAAGHYEFVIRFREHIAPIAHALQG